MIQSNISCATFCADCFCEGLDAAKSEAGPPQAWSGTQPPSPVVATGSFPSHVRSAPCSDCAHCCLTPKTAAVPLFQDQNRETLCPTQRVPLEVARNTPAMQNSPDPCALHLCRHPRCSCRVPCTCTEVQSWVDSSKGAREDGERLPTSARAPVDSPQGGLTLWCMTHDQG
jgi:hypothetical protein